MKNSQESRHFFVQTLSIEEHFNEYEILLPLRCIQKVKLLCKCKTQVSSLAAKYSQSPLEINVGVSLVQSILDFNQQSVYSFKSKRTQELTE